MTLEERAQAVTKRAYALHAKTRQAWLQADPQTRGDLPGFAEFVQLAGQQIDAESRQQGAGSAEPHQPSPTDHP